MTTVFLIRHATTASTGRKLGGRTQTPLDERGRAQAQAAADRLADVPFAAMYASPLARTVETARIVAAPHGLEVRPCDGLLEVEYGRWTDRPLAQVSRQKLWSVVQSRPSLVSFPDGETIRQAQLRAVDALERLLAEHRRRVIAAVTHADVIKAVVAFYLGQPLDLFQRVVIDPASATVLRLEPGGRPALLRLNDDGPLDGARFRRPRPPRKATARRASGPAAARSGSRG